MTAKHFGYYDNWKKEILVCPKCGWKGTFDEGDREVHEELMDSSCPVCHEVMLAIVLFPTIEESEANFDKLSDDEKKSLAARKDFLKRLDQECLRSADQLAELTDSEIHVIWDFEEGPGNEKTTIVRVGERTLWSEPAVWEGFERFAEVVNLLKEKYGNRLKDVAPSESSFMYLYGDRISTISKVDKIRDTLRGS